jgi:hypothetical protein
MFKGVNKDMKKENIKITWKDLPKLRAHLPKQRGQVFADLTKYNRKRMEKGSNKDPFYFAWTLDIVVVL